jgi:hypothetical protein
MSNKKSDLLKWFGTISFLLAATLLSSNIEISRYGFFIFLSGHLALSYLFLIQKDKPMFIQNFFFIFVDAWGIYRWFIA